MCGIAGIFGINGRPVEQAEVQAMCDAIVHRGPNDEGYYVKDNVGIGMRRLSIIDLAGGHQPVCNEDGSVQVVLNGEIYNYRELRRDLIARGHSFYTHSDTEVIVHLYEEYGEDCVRHLRGMFGLALWDANRQRLLIARDRLGKKPLFYGVFGERLVFGSELKAVMQVPDVERRLNWDSVGHLFSFLSTSRTESILEGVHKLPPGHLLSIGRGQAPVVKSYWTLRFTPDHSLSEGDCVERLRELLDESVRLRMISDVPVGAFLSGGVDSSAVVATMARQAEGRVKTFSIGFPEKEYNEAGHAREVAQAFGTDHHELILEPNVVDILEDLAWYLDEPFGDSSAIPTYMVSRLAAEHVTVALSGDGGDELFAGYERYQDEERARARNRLLPGPLRSLLGAVGERMRPGMKGRNFLRELALDDVSRYLFNGSLFDAGDKAALFSPAVAEQVLRSDPWQERLDYFRPGGHWLDSLQFMDIQHYLAQDILVKVDRMSMAHSLETRAPLLDHKLVEFAATIPPEYRLKDGSTKHIFKQAMRGILPDSIIDRRKQGFAVPLGKWFRGELNSLVRDLLLSPSSRARGIFEPAYLERLLAMHAAGRPLDLQLWTLMSFELWCRTFLDQPLRSRPSAPVWQRGTARGRGELRVSGETAAARGRVTSYALV